MNMINHPIMRYHGGKFRIAQWIMSFFPEHIRYVEPFGGAAGVLLQKPRVYSEIYNDMDGDVVNVFRVIQDESMRERLIDLCLITQFARVEFELAYDQTDDPVERARRTLIRAHMGFGSVGATKGNTGFRLDSRRSYALASHLWAKYPSEISSFGHRFAGVIIENRPAVDVIKYHDSNDTLFFIDPPYVHDTRVMGNRCYRYEMTDDDHIEMLNAISDLKGFCVLSGYANDVYTGHLDGWVKHEKKSRISAGRGTALRTESIWLNPRCAEKQSQQRMFA